MHYWTGTGLEDSEEFPGKEFINPVDDLLLAEEYSKLWLRHFEKKDYFLIAYLKNTNISSVSKVPTLLTLGFTRIVRMPRKKKKEKKGAKRKFRNSYLEPYKKCYCLENLSCCDTILENI